MPRNPAFWGIFDGNQITRASPARHTHPPLSYRPKGVYLTTQHKVLRGTLVLDSDLVEKGYGQGRGLAPGFDMFSATFFVKEGPAVGAVAPLLGVSLKKYSGLALGSLVSPLCLNQTHTFAGLAEGRQKFVHGSSAGLTPKPRKVIQRCPVRVGHDGMERCPVGAGHE